MDTSTTNIIGHGRELDFKAINMELIVRMMLPIEPMISPLIVSCFSFIVILPFSLKCNLPDYIVLSFKINKKSQITVEDIIDALSYR